MTKDDVSKILALFSIAGIKFEGNKQDILNLWAECLDDLDFSYCLKATKEIIQNDTEIFANGLIAKVRKKAKDMQSHDNLVKYLQAEQLKQEEEKKNQQLKLQQHKLIENAKENEEKYKQEQDKINRQQRINAIHRFLKSGCKDFELLRN